jgi:hypothetical protein
MRQILVCFSAGCLGALLNSLLAWQFGELGVTRWAGVAMAPTLSPAWLYPRLVWGGIWGLTFLLPVFKTRFLLKGTLLSLLPSAVQLFFIFPYQTSRGIMGLGLGMWTPGLVLVYNWVWGIVTAATIRYSR